MKHGDRDMTEGSIWSQLIGFAAPMAVGLLFQQMYNTVDTIVVGKYVGKDALAAVGSTSPIINMLVGLCAGLATGASVYISQCYGSRENKKLHDAVHTTVLVSFILCVIATVAGLLIVDPMLRLMKTPSDVFGEARIYLTIYFAGVSGLMIYNMCSGILRAVGDSRRPLYFLIFTAIVNTALDLLFVLAFHMGVAGVAYATIISQFLSAILVLFSLTRSDTVYGLTWRDLCLKREPLGKILSVGFPAGIQQAITSFSNVFVQSYINFFGSDCMAGWSSYNKLDAFLLVPVQSIALASTTFVGQNFGAKKYKRARSGINCALLMAIIVIAFLSAVVMIFAEPLLSLFTNEAAVIEYGARFIRNISPFYVLMCFNQVFAGALRGVGKSRTAMIVMLSSFVLFRQLYLIVIKQLGNSFFLVSLAYPMGWLVCSCAMFIFYRRSILCRNDLADGADAL